MGAGACCSRSCGKDAMPPSAGPILAAVRPANLALIRAVRAWGLTGHGDPTEAAAAGLWARFSPGYREQLAATWAATAGMTPELAWQTLLRDHAAASRFDPNRVHPSWFERILSAESPAVAAIVRQHAPESIRSRLPVQSGSTAEHQGGRPRGSATASPAAVEWALATWSERLVGDVAASPNDPPIILALSQFRLRDLVRLARVLGQVKYAFGVAAGPEASPIDPAVARDSPSDRVRVGFFRRTIGRADPRLGSLARADLASVAATRHRLYPTVGLITVARLLKACDPHRARWAVQHIPYPVARLIGSLGAKDSLPAAGLSPRAVRAWESWVLEAAWARLLAEGRLGVYGEGTST